MLTALATSFDETWKSSVTLLIFTRISAASCLTVNRLGGSLNVTPCKWMIDDTLLAMLRSSRSVERGVKRIVPRSREESFSRSPPPARTPNYQKSAALFVSWNSYAETRRYTLRNAPVCSDSNRCDSKETKEVGENRLSTRPMLPMGEEESPLGRIVSELLRMSFIYPTFLEGGDHWEKLDETARAQKLQEETQVIIDEAAALFGDDVVVPGLNSNLGQNTARALDALLRLRLIPRDSDTEEEKSRKLREAKETSAEMFNEDFRNVGPLMYFMKRAFERAGRQSVVVQRFEALIIEEINQTYDVGHSERLKRLLKKNEEHAIWDAISKKTDWMIVVSKGLLQADSHALTLQVVPHWLIIHQDIVAVQRSCLAGCLYRFIKRQPNRRIRIDQLEKAVKNNEPKLFDGLFDPNWPMNTSAGERLEAIDDVLCNHNKMFVVSDGTVSISERVVTVLLQPLV
ncbi:hypothetical protein WR25_08151 [Diploscapter pachys]|uniref:Uncharacterized protein n=1 Tax=Diploscapter pachys TaxID=2018661 RepID=A0A2A2LSU6_9BILA|nr:hypothetical protein WR25_08151 [Diploscapter pachys]